MPTAMQSLKKKAAAQNAKTREKTKLETELGFKIETTKTHRDAEHIAKLKEEAEDRQESINKALGKLLEQMREDKISHVTVRAPAGTLYDFDAVSLGEKVKISKSK